MSFRSFAPDCTLCIGDPHSPAAEKMSNQAPVCEDPDCPDSVCDECSDHEECCEGCVQEGSVCEDCPPNQECCGGCTEDECGILDLINCTGPRCEYHKDYVCDGSCFELFGDQAAEMFGIGGALPQLPIEPKLGEKGNTQHQELMTWEPILHSAPNASTAQHLKDFSDDTLRHSADLLMQAAAASNIHHSHGESCLLAAGQTNMSQAFGANAGVTSENIGSNDPRRCVSKSPAQRSIRLVSSLTIMLRMSRHWSRKTLQTWM